MQPELLSDSKKTTKAGNFSREELQQKLAVAEAEIARLVRELYEARNQKLTDSQALLIAREQLEYIPKGRDFTTVVPGTFAMTATAGRFT